MLMSKAQAGHGTGLTSAIGPCRGGDDATSIDPGIKTADHADIPAVSVGPAGAQSSRAHVLWSHKALTS